MRPSRRGARRPALPTPARRRRARSRRLLALAVVLLVAAAAAVAVLLARRPQPSPDAAAAALAAALTGGRPATVEFANAGPAELRAAWRRLEDGMAGKRAAVTVVGTSVSGDSAVARLRWRWRLAPGRTWSYTAGAALRLRAGRWLPVWSPRLVHPGLRPGGALALVVTQSPRAPILAGDGTPLVVPRPVVNVGVEPRRVRNLTRLVGTLQRVLGIDGPELARAVRAASPDAFVPVITLRRGDYERLRSVLYPLPGTVFTTGTLPLAPTHAFARALLGTTGHPTAQLIAATGGRYAASETVGLSGLEQAFDARLAGRPGLEVRLVDRRGAVGATPYRVAPTRGTPLRTTLDVRTQEAADAALAGVSGPAALVAIRVGTGALLASAVGPDPGGYDIALEGRYPPGSTFKIVTALALLEHGEQPGDPVACPAQVVVDGKPFHNAEHEVLGTIDFARAFAASCNTAFVGLSAKVPGTILPTTARSLGFGAPLRLGVPAFAGLVPAPRDAVELAAEAFGQARVLVSPLALAAAAAAVAGGRYLPPHVVEGAGIPPQAAGPALPTGPVATLRTLMREVVTSGTATVLAGQPGLPVFGKTGTAEFGTANPPRTDAWFVGWQGDVAFACLVADTAHGFGGTVAAPIVGRFLAALGG